MERYSSYKDSGEKWLGEIPGHWEMVRFRYNGTFTKGKLPKSTNGEEKGLPIIGASEMLGHPCRSYSEDTSPVYCEPDDILILWDGANAGIISHNHTGIVSSTAVKYSCTNPRVNKDYLYYLVKAYERIFKQKVSGTTIPHMSMSYINGSPLLLPPLPEQRAIVTYLDRVTGDIDRAIEESQKMIDLLNERKQIIIQHAVTKGLNNNAKLKYSGVEWIGEVPEHWDVRKLRYLCRMKTGDKDTIMRQEDGEYPFFVRSPKIERINSYTFDKEAILMAGDGAGAGRIFHYYKGKFGCHQRVYCLHDFSKDIYPQYLYYQMSHFFKEVFLGISAKSTVDSVRLPMLKDFQIVFPKVSEQQQIVSFIEEAFVPISQAIASAERKIALLRERKQIIINEVVTGKVKVS